VAAVDAAAEGTHVLDVLDAGQGLTQLLRRDPTLDGGVPLRVAQACVPLLDGIAWGFQVTLQRPIVITQKLGGWKVDSGAELEALHAAARVRLRAHGFLDGKQDLPPVVDVRRGVVHLWTGLLVRPVKGLWARISAVGYRRSRDFDVEEYQLTQETLVPLVLRLRLTTDRKRVVLVGELACLAPLVPGVRFSVNTLAEKPELGEAHAAFFDATYFQAKKTGVTRRYRKLVADLPDAAAPACVAELVTAGPTRAQVNAGNGSVEVCNEIPFSARFDGHTLDLDFPSSALKEAASAIEKEWVGVFGADFVERNRGALLYLQKYFTQHPPGEPHFFVKPFAFVRTPPGWSCLLEGIHGNGYDVLRGVVHTDVFHATPAVFQLHGSDRDVKVDLGAPLVRVFPIPRTLMNPRLVHIAWPDEEP
jgi:hypothetical protein